MKNKTIFVIMTLAALTLASCRKIETGLTDVTYYAVIELEGANPYVIHLGESYTEPGFTAILNGEDISSKVSVGSNVDSSTPGIYSVTYSAVNEDGFSSSVSRAVYVLNPGGIDNLYSSYTRIGSTAYRVPAFLIKATGTAGVYEMEDLLGGFYYYGRYPGYEPTYDFHCESRFSINDDNTLKLISTGSWYFGSSYDYSTFTGTYDPATGVLDFNFDGVFVTLTPFNN